LYTSPRRVVCESEGLEKLRYQRGRVRAMKAVIWTRYGSPEVLEIHEVDKPSPKKNEVLIKVHATTVETGDCELRRYRLHNYFYMLFRPYFGLFRPRLVKTLGQQLSGEVEAVGSSVTKFKVGDAIFAGAEKMGATAEYICLPENDAIVIKPDKISFEEAAAVTVGGINALHFLKKAKIQPKQKVLIYGSTGAIGTFAVQLAKHLGAEVTAVCSGGKIELVKSLGADHIIDYTSQSLSDVNQSYDVIFDTIGKSPYAESLSVLKPGGIYLLANPTLRQQLRSYWTHLTSNKRTTCRLANNSAEDLNYLKQLIEQNTLKVIVDRSYPMEQIVEAHHYVEQGHKNGNVVITLAREII